MRVLHVIDALGLGGGAEQALVAQLPLLREAGIDGNVVCLYERERGLFEDVARLGFDVATLQARTWPGRVRELRRVVRVQRPDLVHATLMHSCFVTRFAMVGTGTPQLNSVVNTTYDPVRVELLRLNARRVDLIRRFDGLTARRLGGHFHALTEAVAAEIVEALGVGRDRITVIPRGRAFDQFTRSETARATVRRQLDLGAEQVLVLAVGRQDLQKAHVDLIEAVYGVRQSGISMQLAIAGRAGAASEAIDASIERLEARSWVHVLGHRTDIAQLMSGADVFALPSLYEGLGSVLIEAMAAGLPIVGSDAPAIREVLGGGEFGLVHTRGDTASIAGALQRLADQDERERLTHRAQEEAHRRYRLQSIVQQTTKLYESVAEGL